MATVLVTRAQVLAARTLIERAVARGRPVRPEWRLIADARRLPGETARRV
jgi:hypothetical protein